MPTLAPTQPNQTDIVDAWRLHVLLLAGYPQLQAELLATDPDVNLHEATTLLERGCPPDTAARILL